MKKDDNILVKFLRSYVGRYVALGIVIVIAIAVAVAYIHSFVAHQHLGIAPINEKIDITPEQIRSIEKIGQWEFLAVSDEELVELTKTSFFGDSKLVNIYVGTVRIGVDMTKVADGWLHAHGDTVTAVLPKVGLLDRRFIDEARTRAFYESGTWTAADREVLYQRAYRLMEARCLTRDNLLKAEENARDKFTELFRSMGFHTVEITFR